MSSVKNTFIPDRPCMNAEEHVGREDLARITFERLSSDDVQSTVIIGAPKFGKTSFVNYLQQPAVAQHYLGEKAERYVFVHINCKEKHLINKEAFFKEVFQQAQNVLPGISTLDKSNDTAIIDDWLKAYNKRLVLMLDDFHLIITNPSYLLPFFEGLRAWFSNNKYVGCVITSPIEIESLDNMPPSLKGSPFFNIFDCYHLSFFTLSEAVKLLDSRLPKQLQKHPEEMLEIIRQVGFYPYELHIAGSQWSAYFAEHRKIHREALLERLQSELQVYYESIYQDLKGHQKDTIKSLLKADSKIKSVDNKLVADGWVGKYSNKLTALQMEVFFQKKFFPKKTTMLSRWISKKTN